MKNDKLEVSVSEPANHRKRSDRPLCESLREELQLIILDICSYYYIEWLCNHNCYFVAYYMNKPFSL